MTVAQAVEGSSAGARGPNWKRLGRHPGEKKRALASVATLALCFLVAWVRQRHADHPTLVSLLGSFFVLALVWWASVLLHEVGHAVGARLAGLRPIVLLAGGGPVFVRRRIAGLGVDIRWLPGSGLTTFGSDALPRMRWRLFSTYAGGPLVTVLLLALGFQLPGAFAGIHAAVTQPLPLSSALILVNAYLLFVVIVPMPRGSDVTTPRNDLSQMLGLPWLPKAQIEALSASGQSAEFARLALLKDYEGAAREGRRILANAPANWAIRAGLAELLLFAGAYSEAAEHYSRLLEEQMLPEGAVTREIRAVIANNLAYSLYMLDDPAVVDRADRWSAESHATLPKHPSILGTRGAVLVEIGRIAEGRVLVERAYGLHRDPHARASNLASLAIADAKAGRRDSARELLREARKLDHECDLLVRAERDIAEPADDSPPPRTAS